MLPEHGRDAPAAYVGKNVILVSVKEVAWRKFSMKSHMPEPSPSQHGRFDLDSCTVYEILRKTKQNP